MFVYFLEYTVHSTRQPWEYKATQHFTCGYSKDSCWMIYGFSDGTVWFQRHSRGRQHTAMIQLNGSSISCLWLCKGCWKDSFWTKSRPAGVHQWYDYYIYYMYRSSAFVLCVCYSLFLFRGLIFSMTHFGRWQISFHIWQSTLWLMIYNLSSSA